MRVVKSVSARLDNKAMDLIKGDTIVVFPFDGERGLVMRKDDESWVVEVTYQGEWVVAWDDGKEMP